MGPLENRPPERGADRAASVEPRAPQRISPYVVTETLLDDGRKALRRATRAADGLPVVIKALDPRNCRPKDIERLRHEYEIGASLGLRAIVKPLALEAHEGMPALILEDYGGRPLDRLIAGSMPTESFLELAVRIAGAVAELHQRGVIHKDLKPENILVHPASLEVKLADLGLATRIPREQQAARPPQLIEGTLPYMSPEQTGRMNRALDSRSDLYSLGVTFYQMLTGRLPFEAGDALEWVHCHVARAPVPLAQLVPDIPVALDTIVTKLLAKVAEDRYQTARGLQRDLELCLERWRESGRIEAFPLGRHDVPDRLQLPQKLYGRDREIAALVSAFERVAATQLPELVLVSGYSGIGKSSLVHELEKPVFRRNGLFIEGKFDQHRRDVPYSTIAQAFRELVLDLLAQGEQQVASWRERLGAALGMNGQLIADVIPELELLVGRHRPVPELPPSEARNRFHSVFRRFVGAFARKEHPLTIFVDDLQWADPASIALLQDLVTHPEVGCLIVVGAYRDNEVAPVHPLAAAVESVRRAGGNVSDVVVGPLSGEDLTALVADALHCPPTDAEPLAELVLEKTGANPFFVVQFLSVLYREGLVEFDAGAARWRWDVARIRAQGYTDNVSELMVGKLRHLPAETQRALELAACIGATVDVEALATVCQRYPEPLVRPALEEDLLLRVEGAYRFPHDRVQEAAYSLISETERAATHLRIGRLLLAHLPREQVEEKSFEIANQLNRGSALIDSVEEREQLAELNLTSGLRAKGSTAYASALKYLAAGSALLGEDAWDRRYDLAFALELNRAECEYLTGNLDAAEQRLVALSRRARDLHVAAVASAQCDLYTTQGHGDRAVDAFLEYMRRVGVSWSPRPTKDEVRLEFEGVWRQLGNRPIESLAHLRAMTDPAARATIEFMMWAHPPAQFFDENLGALAIARMVNLSLEHGNSDASGLAYVWFGSLLGSQFADYEAGYRFGKVGLELVEERGLLRFQSRVYVIFGALVIPHSRHVREGIPLIRRAYDTAREACDLSYACYARNAFTTLLLAAGEPLGDVERETEDALHFVQKAKFGMMVDILENKLRLVRTLRGVTQHSASSYEEEEARLDALLQGDRSLAIAVCWYFIRKLQERYYAGDHRAAAAAAARAEALLWTSPSFVEEAECRFYAALARAAQCDDAPPGERLRNLQAVATDRERLRLWEKHCPENFQDRYALVSAELARIEGRELDAQRLYEQAVRAARENGFVQNEALANELASRFYRARGYDRVADLYLRDALACYARWGADGKVRQLERLQPPLLERRAFAPTATVAVRAEQLDLLAIVRASQTISGEMELETLTGTLLELVLKQGGARRACLVLARGGDLWIEAEAALQESGVTEPIRSPVAVKSSARLPASVLHSVRRIREPVIIDDAAAGGHRFAGDPYFARHRTRSVLCLPIVRDELVGLLYLENDLVAHAFTPDRLTALSLLASQAAISVENAHLLRDLREREARIRRLFESNIIGIFFWRLNGTIDQANDAFVKMVGYGRDDVVSHRVSWADLTPPEYVEADARAIAELQATGTCRPYEKEYLHKDGHRVPVLLGGALLEPSGDEGVAFAVDLTERKQAEAKATAYEIERKRAEALAELDRAKTAFFSNVSHELRTPLTLALGPLEALLEGRQITLLADAREQLATAHRNCLKLMRLVNTLLDFSRIEAGGSQATYVPTDVSRLTADVASAFRSACEAAHLRLRIGCPPLPSPVHVDPDMWEKIVVNLVSNAFKFTLEGEIEVKVRAAGDRCELSVRDTGVGIPEAELPRIFDRFHRVDGSRGRTLEGTGIGLALVKELVELHGGSVEVASVLGHGTTFTVAVPFGTAHVPRERIAAARTPPEPAVTARPYVEEALRWVPEAQAAQREDAAEERPGVGRARVLVADDNADMRAYVRFLLAPRYEVETVADGEAALEAARRARPGLVLSDIMMPRLDGFGLLQEIRADPALRTVPVVLLSARSGEEARVGGLEAGADDYLVKPFSARELLARVTAHLELARLRQEAERERAARAAAEEAIRIRDEFLSLASHELRTPVTALDLSLRGLERVAHQDDLDRASLRRAADIAARQGRRLKRLIGQVLDVSRIELGHLPLDLSDVELGSIVRDVIERFAPNLSRAGCTVSLQVAGPVVGRWDRSRLDQVVTNLLANAMTFGAGAPIEIAIQQERGAALLHVRDHGIGIDPAQHEAIFERFGRAAPTRHYGGLGIGLYISRYIVEAHGGKIRVDSAPGKGSTFTVELPSHGRNSR